METELMAVNAELLAMMSDRTFDETRARELLDTVPEIDGVFLGPHRSNTTYMDQAVAANNIRMVKLLFEYGADPNFHGDKGWICPFWDLQYRADDEEDDKVRLSIVQTFLENGADPLPDPEEIGNTLFSWAETSNCELDWDDPRQDHYRFTFCDMLEDVLFRTADQRLLEACTAKEIDYGLVQDLLIYGANPMAEIREPDGTETDNLYTIVVDFMLAHDEVPEDLYRITELFLEYDMDIAKPSVPYDDDNVLNPLWLFSFSGDETVLKTLKLLLDHGLKAKDAACCWNHEICDLVQTPVKLTDEGSIALFEDYLRKLMLIASYPHVLNADPDLQKEIWYDSNSYDLTGLRNWNGYRYEIDTSYCEHGPEARRSVVTIIEKKSELPVWRFGVCLTPEDIQRKNI